jgi:hypothetical protein
VESVAFAMKWQTTTPTDSRPQYMVSNIGSDTVAVELKIWLESMGGAAIPLISIGADGSLVFDAGETLTLDPLASVQLLSEAAAN